MQNIKKVTHNMAKIVPTVLLNDIQMATLLELQSKAVEGVLSLDVIAGYKGNVVNALLRRGVIKGLYRKEVIKNYKLTGVPVEMKPETVHREPKVAPIVETDTNGVTA
jgi:hypothetical protein